VSRDRPAREIRRRLGAQTRLALCAPLDYSRIVTLDADLSHDPCDILRLLAALDADPDVAIGSRFAPGGGSDLRGWRRFLSRSANHLARHLLRLPIAECTTSLRAGFFLTAAVRFVRAGLSRLALGAMRECYLRGRRAWTGGVPPAVDVMASPPHQPK
jgi:hypothetical protein